MIKKYNKFVEDRLVKEDVQVAPEEFTQNLPEEPIQELPEEEEEEEGSEYVGDQKMKELAKMLGTEKNQNGSIEYKGREINFYSETEKFHVDNKKFNTAEEVVAYLEGGDKHTHTHKKVNEPVQTEDDQRLDPEFEAKSYRNSRKFKKLK